MSSRLGRVWFSSAIARLTRHSYPRGEGGREIRRRLYMVYIRDRYKVRRYRGEVLITLVSVLVITPLAIIRAVIYIYIYIYIYSK